MAPADIAALLQETFQGESQDLLQRLRQALAAAEEAGAQERSALLKSIWRDLHTLKGSAAAVGYRQISDVCHALESLLSVAGPSLPEDVLDTAHDALGWVERATACGPGSAPDTPAQLEAIEAVHQCFLGGGPTALVEAPPSHPPANHPGPRGPVLAAQGPAAQASAAQASAAQAPAPPTPAAPVLPALARTAAPLPAPGPAQAPATPVSSADARSPAPPLAAQVLPEAPPTPAARATPTAPGAPTSPQSAVAPRATIRVDAARIEQVSSVIGDLIVATLQQQSTSSAALELNEEMDRLLLSWRRLHGSLREALPSTDSAAARTSRRLKAFTADMTAIKRHIYRLSGGLQRQSGELSLLTDVLQEGLHRVRLLPVRPMLESFRPPIRDAARATGRRVRLVIEDSDAEVDRVVMEQLREPLLHLVRNAVAHGLERPEDREACGKQPVGEVRLSVEVEGEHTRFTVADDGRGVQRQKIADKAAAAGILKPSRDPLDDEQLLEVLCHSGFSTAATVDRVSGRGVGMDVVREVIQGLGGSIGLESVEGEGSTFSLRVPSRFTSSVGFITACGDYRFGILMRDVERIIRVRPEAITVFRGANVLQIDGAPLLAVPLLELLGEPGASLPTHSTPALLLRSGGMRAVVLVDDIPAEIPMVVKPLGPQLAAHRRYAGCALEGDGSALPVLDVGEMLRQLLGSGVRTRVTATPPATPTKPTVLLVEDSLTMRTLEQSILESAGFVVVPAGDGQTAYEHLVGGATVDIVVTDVNMPRMDGFSLCERIRAEVSSSLPVVIVTSQGSREDKQRGGMVGADAYIIKGNFEQDHFLGTINRLVQA